MPNSEFLLTALIVIVMPGAGVLYILATGLSHGWRVSLLASLACTLGIVPHMLASILGLAALLHTSAIAFEIVKIAGIAYLLYLAWRTWQTPNSLMPQAQKSSAGWQAITSRALLITILNPKLSLFFLAFLPHFVSAQAGSPVQEMLWLSALYMLMTLVVFAGYGLLAGTLRILILQSPRALKALQRSFAITFLALGAKLALAER
ncbi:MAG: LysE family translocator [Pseudomonadales bacterium]